MTAVKVNFVNKSNKMENNLHTKSLLHPKIAKLYKLSENIDAKPSAFVNYIKPNGTYNWNSIDKLLFGDGNISKHDPIYPKTYDEFYPYVQLLQPILQQSKSALAQSSDNISWLERLKWLCRQSCLELVLQEYHHPTSATSTMENILFLTSALENALGNVYQTIAKKSPPHLLKDLLDTKELRNALGTGPIFFLKILMGSPESINLRNIVWHGFPMPSEVPLHFVSTLLLVSASLSEQLESLKVIPRAQVNDFSRFLAKIQSAPIDFDLLGGMERVMKTIETSHWTGQWKIYWNQLLHHYQEHNYWRFIILILPQIELVLRKMYGEANNFDVTAKLDEYYITMTSIFEASEDNRLLDGCLSRGTLHFLYDIFVSPFGMRIRDKVSHGEVQLDCVDKDLCSVLLYAGLNLLNRDAFPLEHYESRFHLNCLAYDAIAASKRCVIELMNLQTPSGLGKQIQWNQDVMLSLQELIVIKQVEIFGRSKKEPEIMANIMKIAQLVVQVCENYQVSFKERFRMFLSHDLRSRARKTLEKMVEALSVIGETLANIVGALVKITGTFQLFEDGYQDLQRFFKQSLKIVENLVRCSDKESNEWLNALECCHRFQEVYSRLFAKHEAGSLSDEILYLN